MEAVELGETVQRYLGVEIRECAYSSMCGQRNAVVAMLPDRPVLCHDVSAAMNYIGHIKKKGRRK